MRPPAVPAFVHVTRNGLRFDRCPKAWLRDEAAGAVALIDDWRHYNEHGVMPRAGGRHDQSPRFIDAVETIDDELVRLKRHKAN